MDRKHKNKDIKRATALKYDGKEAQTPQVTAAGKGLVAENIIRIAKENNIPVHEDPELAQALSGIEIGEEIPPALYQAVAEVLAFILQLDK
ncbi:MAG: hypothetical protein GX318_07745 [Clostridia bacterium]|nr:hypothetical protein [Clostridia bacterium]